MRPEDHQLVAYLYGELSEEDARGVERALAADPELRKQMDDLRVTRLLFGTLEDPKPSPFVRTRLKAEAREAAAEARGEAGGWASLRRRLLHPLTGLAAAGVLAGVVAVTVPVATLDEAAPAAVEIAAMPAAPAPETAAESAPVGSKEEVKLKADAPAALEPAAAPAIKPAPKKRARRAREQRRPRRSAPLAPPPAAPPRTERRAVAKKRPADAFGSGSGAGASLDTSPVSPEDDEAGSPAPAGRRDRTSRTSAQRFIDAADAELARGDRHAARAVLARGAERTRGSPDQGWVWLRWAEIEFEDDQLEMADTYANRALRVKGFRGRSRARALRVRIDAQRTNRRSAD